MTDYSRAGAIAAVAARLQLPAQTVAAVLDAHALYLAIAGFDSAAADRWLVQDLRRRHRDLLPGTEGAYEVCLAASFVFRLGVATAAVIADVLASNVEYAASIGSSSPAAALIDGAQLSDWLARQPRAAN